MGPPGLPHPILHILPLQPLLEPLDPLLQVKHGVLVPNIGTRRLVQLRLEENLLR